MTDYKGSFGLDKKTKKKRLLIGLAIVLVWAVLIVVMALVYHSSPANPKNQAEIPTGMIKNPSVTRVINENMGPDVNRENYLGYWISDRTTRTLLELKEDGTFEDELWMGSGKYIVNGPYLMLDNGSGQEHQQRVLRYQETDGEPELFFNIYQYKTLFHRASEQEIAEVKAYIEDLKKSNTFCGVDPQTIDPSVPSEPPAPEETPTPEASVPPEENNQEP